MKKMLTFFTVMILAGSMQANAQSQFAKSTISPVAVPVEKFSKSTDPLPVAMPVSTEAQSDIKVIDGRNVRVDSQGVQSLEAVAPSAVPKPKTESIVK